MPGLTHFSYPARDEEWHQELPVSQAGPAVPRTERTRPPRPGRLGLSTAPRTELSEGAGENSALPRAKHSLSCLWFTGRSVRHGLLCLSLLCSPPGSSDNERDELLLAERRKKYALLASLYPCQERERANSYSHWSLLPFSSFCTASNCTRTHPWGQTTFGCTSALME